MRFLRARLWFMAGDFVEVHCNAPANVMLLSGADMLNYQSGAAFRYYGFQAHQFSAQLAPPEPGTWHLVVDTRGLGEYQVQATYAMSRAGGFG